MTYFDRALVAAVLVGALCGLVGTVVVLRRRAFTTQALTHATFPGAMLAAAFGLPVLVGAAVTSVILVGVVAALGRARQQGLHVASGIVLTAGFALGISMQAWFPDVPIQVESFLVGSILTVSDADLVVFGVVLLLAMIAVAVFGRLLVFSTFDPAGYSASGFRLRGMELLVLGMIAVTVVVAMPAVGSILALALIAAPAAAVLQLVNTASRAFIVAPLVGASCAVAGVFASRALSISAGGAIAVISALVFLGALVITRKGQIRWWRRPRTQQVEQEARA